jgi:hypothetical protein
VMGLGMGATMMPIMASALATLTAHTTARGSTLLNIVQQVAASIGTALFSVLLTNGIKDSEAGGAYIFLKSQVAQLSGDQLAGAKAKLAAIEPQALPQLGEAYAGVFVVATILVGLCLVPAFLLPRKPPEQPVDPSAMMGH